MKSKEVHSVELKLDASSIPGDCVFLSVLSAIIVPLIIWLGGLVLATLNPADSIVIPFWESGWTAFSAERSRLSSALMLLLGIALLGLVQASVLLLHYRRASEISVARSRRLYELMMSKSRLLARLQSVSGQRSGLRGLLQDDVPEFRDYWSFILRSVPRHAFQIVTCLTLAVLIDWVTALLAIVCFALLRQLHVWTLQTNRRRQPVLVERVDDAQRELHESFESTPLLESVHSEEFANGVQQELLGRFLKARLEFERNSIWEKPLVVFVSTMMSLFICSIVAVRILDESVPLDVPGAVTIGAAMFFADLGFTRVIKSRSMLGELQPHAAQIERFLSQAIPEEPQATTDQTLRPLVGITLDHVTLRGGNRDRLLEEITVELPNNRMIAVVGTDHRQVTAFGELLLGYGQPGSGRLLFGEKLSSDLTTECFRNHFTWVASDGPIITSTLRNNLGLQENDPRMIEVDDAFIAMRVKEVFQYLPDGLATIIYPQDDRLTPDQQYRIGLARAAIKAPSLVVAQEPDVRVQANVEEDSTAAFRSLVSEGRVTVVIPARSITLRESDMVVVLHEHQVVDVGRHAELLNRCEIYRHINYVRFSPLMHRFEIK